jgi:hypothetical protein
VLCERIRFSRSRFSLHIYDSLRALHSLDHCSNRSHGFTDGSSIGFVIPRSGGPLGLGGRRACLRLWAYKRCSRWVMKMRTAIMAAVCTQETLICSESAIISVDAVLRYESFVRAVPFEVNVRTADNPAAIILIHLYTSSLCSQSCSVISHICKLIVVDNKRTGLPPFSALAPIVGDRCMQKWKQSN